MSDASHFVTVENELDLLRTALRCPLRPSFHCHEQQATKTIDNRSGRSKHSQNFLLVSSHRPCDRPGDTWESATNLNMRQLIFRGRKRSKDCRQCDPVITRKPMMSGSIFRSSHHSRSFVVPCRWW